MDNEKAVADFLSEQIKRREDERKQREDEVRRLSDQFVQTNRANLGYLLATWRFVLVTRAALVALAVAALQYVIQNIASFLDTTRLVTVFQTFFGKTTISIGAIQLMTSLQAGTLVAIIVVTIVFVTILIDFALALLQKRCVVRGLDAERYLNARALFFEIHWQRRWVSLPFWLARFAIMVFGIAALWFLLSAR